MSFYMTIKLKHNPDYKKTTMPPLLFCPGVRVFHLKRNENTPALLFFRFLAETAEMGQRGDEINSLLFGVGFIDEVFEKSNGLI